MKRPIIPLVTAAFTIFSALPTAAQPRFSGHGFNDAGAFQMTVSGPSDVESSPDMQTWSKFASVSQAMTLEDLASRRMEWRFYRLRREGASDGGVIGFVRVPIAAGKMALLGNAFAGPLRLDQPASRSEVFGATNPPVKVSLYANGNFVPHTLDTSSGAWTPPLRSIREQEGFSIQNTGSQPLTVRLSGSVRHGQFQTTAPAGSSLVIPPVPQPGPLAQVLNIPGKDGMQIHWFDLQTQNYQVSTFDGLDNAWIPKLPDYRPGRSFVLKTPQAVNWTINFPANAK